MTRGAVWGSSLRALAAVLLPFVLYVETLLPGLGGSGDTMKFQFIGRILGIPHSPGYPGYVLLGYLFSWLPVGSLAYRMNLMSAVFAALTCGLIYAVVCLLTEDRWAALGAALLLAVSRVFWAQAIVAEVYALNAFYVAATILALLIWERRREDRYLYLACAVYALSFGNHLSMVTLLPAFVLFVLWADPEVTARRRNWLVIGLIVLVAASQYGYLWIRSHQELLYSEMPVDPTWRQFIWYVTGGIFKGRMFALRLSEVLGRRVPLYLSSLTHQFSTAGVLLGALGLYRLLAERRKEGLMLLVGWLGSLTFSLSYGIDYIYPFFVPSYVLFAVLVGCGLAELLRWAGGRPRWRQWVSVAGTALLILTASFGAARTCLAVNQSRNVSTDEDVGRILRRVEGHSLLVTASYSTNVALLYKLYGEEIRSGEQIYTAVGPEPASIVRAYWRGEKGISSGYGTLDHLPGDLRVYYVDPDPAPMESAGLRLRAVDCGDGDLARYLGALPRGTWVLLGTRGDVVSYLSQVEPGVFDALGLEGPPRDGNNTCYAAVGVVGAGDARGEEQAGRRSARIEIRRGETVAGYDAPADLRVVSVAKSGESRWRQSLADLRGGRWADAWHALLSGRGESRIEVGGHEYSPDRPGLNIVLVEPVSGRVMGKGSVDLRRTLGVNEVVIYEVVP